MIKFYHTENCPICKGVERLLSSKHIDYEDCMDINEMIKLGITNVPVLKVDDNILRGKDIYSYLNSLN